MNTDNLTPQQLRRAADLKEKILSLQAELNQILDGSAPFLVAASKSPRDGRGRNLSAAGRAAISAAAKARWARQKGVGGAERARKPKRKMTAAGRAAISAAAKARWARVRAAGRSRL
jgi:hypothetical protein